MSLWLLFISAFGAATLLPLQSEALLWALLHQANNSAGGLIIVASVGNILGSCVNWYLGTKIVHYQQKSWFPVTPRQLQRAQQIYQKYGFWSLLFSWLPVIGDPITLIAGVMKENFFRFVVLVSLAKVGRYGCIYLVFMGWWLAK